MLTLMTSTRVEDAESRLVVDEGLRSSTILEEPAGVACPDSLPVEPSSEASMISSMFSGFHARGPYSARCGAFASALSDTGAALGGSFWSSASRLTCLALAAVAAAYSAALACAPRPDISFVRRGRSSSSGRRCCCADQTLSGKI